MRQRLLSRRQFCAGTSLLALGASLPAAPQKPQEEQPNTTFSTELKLVSVLATVRTKQGQLVADLNKDDFSLAEDGHPQTIRYFSHDTNLPLILGILIDSSGSQRRVLGAECRASDGFIQQVLREDRDRAFVAHFDRDIVMLQNLTPSKAKLQRALTALGIPEELGNGRPIGPRIGGGRRGGTALFDASILSCDKILRRQAGRKALIILSDGVDNGSLFGEAEAIQSAEQADTLLYSILFSDEQAYGGGGRGGEGKDVLKRLSRDTGGGFFEVSKKLPLTEVFRQIEEELRNQYSIGYKSDRDDGSTGFRKIRLKTRQKGLIVQARDGYYPAVPSSP